MDPDTRTLLQVTIEDAADADKVFDMLMGASVPPRRRFIQTHARQVRNPGYLGSSKFVLHPLYSHISIGGVVVAFIED